MNRRKIKVKVYAKINLSLNITGVCGALHTLDMVTASVNIADAVSVCERFDDSIDIGFSSNFSAPADNTVQKAVCALRALFGDFGADIFIEKKIPVAAGMGGSSADAAAVMVALDTLYGFSRRGADLILIAQKIGSDTPSMLTGGYLRIQGTGEKIEPLECAAPLDIVICNGSNGVSTAEAYKKFDLLCPSRSYIAADNDSLLAALKKGDIGRIAKCTGNALYKASALLEPPIAKTLESLQKNGALAAFMTGSGSACAGIYANSNDAMAAAEKISGGGLWARACKTVSRGIEITE